MNHEQVQRLLDALASLRAAWVRTDSEAVVAMAFAMQRANEILKEHRPWLNQDFHNQ